MQVKILTLSASIALLLTCSCSAPKPTGFNKPRPEVSLDTILSCDTDPIIANVFKTDLATMHKVAEATAKRTRASRKGSDDPTIHNAGFMASVAPRFFDPKPIPNFAVNHGPLSAHELTESPGGYCEEALSETEYPSDSDRTLPSAVFLYGRNFTFDAHTVFLRADEFTFQRRSYNPDAYLYYLLARKGRVTLRLVPEGAFLRLYDVVIGPDELKRDRESYVPVTFRERQK